MAFGLCAFHKEEEVVQKLPHHDGGVDISSSALGAHFNEKVSIRKKCLKLKWK